MWRKALRISAAAMLVLVLVDVLTGCFYIPIKPKVVRGTDVRQSVGLAGSGKPLRIGYTTRQQVMAVLGPGIAARGSSDLIYTWNVRHGYEVYVLCFMADKHDTTYSARLTFDEHDVLRSCRVWDGGSGIYLFDMRPKRPATTVQVMEQVDSGQ